MTKAIFVTGTGTDIGKTYISGLLLKKMQKLNSKNAYYKAAMSGNLRNKDGSLLPGDAAFVKKCANLEQPLETMCPYVYETAVSPHLASRLEGNPVKFSVVKKHFAELCMTYDYIIMEGSGGICCPLDYDSTPLYLENIITKLHLTSILVADAGLGTINNVVLTNYYMKAKGLPLAGIIFNNYHPGNTMEEDNIFMSQKLTGLPLIAKVEANATDLDIESHILEKLFQEVKL